MAQTGPPTEYRGTHPEAGKKGSAGDKHGEREVPAIDGPAAAHATKERGTSRQWQTEEPPEAETEEESSGRTGGQTEEKTEEKSSGRTGGQTEEEVEETSSGRAGGQTEEAPGGKEAGPRRGAEHI